jgi:hypothetical protein
MFRRKMMFKRAELMEVAWSKVGAIRRMLEDFPLFLLHDNARSHTANKTNEKLRNFKWEVLEHPPYSPDLAPSDFICSALLNIIFRLNISPLGKSRPGSDSSPKNFMLMVFRVL